MVLEVHLVGGSVACGRRAQGFAFIKMKLWTEVEDDGDDGDLSLTAKPGYVLDVAVGARSP